MGVGGDDYIRFRRDIFEIMPVPFKHIIIYQMSYHSAFTFFQLSAANVGKHIIETKGVFQRLRLIKPQQMLKYQ